MNVNLCGIIRRIIAEQGEAILAEPQRLKAYVSDYAKNEAPAERLAFGRCIEAGAYMRLKNVRGPAERQQVKAALARQLQQAAGLGAAQCQSALDTLEAALFGAPAYQAAPHDGATPAPARKISKKTYAFGMAAGLGALAGELASDLLRLNSNDGASSFGALIANVALWAALLGLGISAGLLIVQNRATRKRPDVAQIVKTALSGIVVGAAAGAAAQFIFGITWSISTPVEVVSRIACWGLLGLGLGRGASFYIPNYPPKRAMLAGLLGGAAGGAVFRALVVIPEPFNRILGVVILGAFIGFSISFIEEALREAWLTVIWAANETTTVSLGEKPVSFGASREADVYLPHRLSEKALPVRAVFSIENGRVVVSDYQSGGKFEPPDGGSVDLGRVRVTVHAKRK
jgi:hypothetical protein